MDDRKPAEPDEAPWRPRVPAGHALAPRRRPTATQDGGSRGSQ